ncbi:MAG: hypothetical protein P1R58_02690 [bacterium]|nr:hypothetical protein [bacterium]
MNRVRKIRHPLVYRAVLSLLVVCIVGCDNGSTGNYEIPDTAYQNWSRITVGKVTMIYPPGHPHEPNMQSTAAGYESAQAQICNFFGIPVPTDSIYVYYYTGLGQGREMTGHEWVFADSNHIHFWMPSFLGVSLTDYLLPKWIAKEPKYSFLKSGLLALFDFSGNNYHESVLNFIDRGHLISLDSLGRDTTSNINTERYQSAHAASFIAFYLDTYGKPSFEQLYQSEDEFAAAIKRLTSLETDSVQALWLNFAEQKYNETLGIQ